MKQTQKRDVFIIQNDTSAKGHLWKYQTPVFYMDHQLSEIILRNSICKARFDPWLIEPSLKVWSTWCRQITSRYLQWSLVLSSCLLRFTGKGKFVLFRSLPHSSPEGILPRPANLTWGLGWKQVSRRQVICWLELLIFCQGEQTANLSENCRWLYIGSPCPKLLFPTFSFLNQCYYGFQATLSDPVS